MKNTEIKEIRDKVGAWLKDRRMRDAFSYVKNMAEGMMLYEITDRVKRLEETYKYMLAYLTAGAEDPHREQMLNDMISEMYQILDSMELTLMLRETPTLYYNIRRYFDRNGAATSLSAMMDRWESSLKMSTSLSALYNDGRRDSTRKNLEQAEQQLFNRIWTSYPLKRQDASRLVELILAPETSLTFSVRMISAIGLASVEFADKNALEALCNIYTETAGKEDAKSRRITAAALIWLVICLARHKDTPFMQATKNRLAALRDIPSWKSDLKIVFMEIIRSRDTERINRTMKDQIIPGMMAMRPEIERKLKDIDPTKIDEEMAMNPEWEDMLNKSGLGDKIKQLNHMQMEGSDVFMSTFSHLKNFPYFNEAVNWFTPLESDNIYIEKITGDNPALSQVVELIQRVPFLCDSDKFSMLLSVEMLPEEQRKMMLGQIEMQSGHFDEIAAHITGITSPDQRRTEVRNELQNLYRFLNLFRRKGEFYNIFKHDTNLLTVPELAGDLEDTDMLKLTGEFYFKRGYYEDAIAAFSALDNLNQFNAILYQKLGYAYEKTNRPDLAVKYYEQADLLDSSSRWLKIKLAKAYRTVGELDQALEVLDHLLQNNDGDTEAELMKGYTLIRAHRYKEALKSFYKVEFIQGENARVARPIAWALFMTGNFEKASKYYDNIILDNPTGEDYLNMGHTALAQSLFKEAINYYKLYILADGNDKESFFKALEMDTPDLEKVGVPRSTISLIADCMLYDLE